MPVLKVKKDDEWVEVVGYAIDVDTVDGMHASEFAPFEHSHNYAGSESAGGAATKAVGVVDPHDEARTIKVSYSLSSNQTSYFPIFSNAGKELTAISAANLLNKIGAAKQDSIDSLIGAHVWAVYTGNSVRYNLGEPEEIALSKWGTVDGVDCGDPDTVTYYDYKYNYAHSDGAINTYTGGVGTITINDIFMELDVLRTKFVDGYYIPVGATFTGKMHSSSGYSVVCSGARKMTVSETGEYFVGENGVSFVYSVDKSTYPMNGKVDGDLYVYQGRLGGVNAWPL